MARQGGTREGWPGRPGPPGLATRLRKLPLGSAHAEAEPGAAHTPHDPCDRRTRRTYSIAACARLAKRATQPHTRTRTRMPTHALAHTHAQFQGALPPRPLPARSHLSLSSACTCGSALAMASASKQSSGVASAWMPSTCPPSRTATEHSHAATQHRRRRTSAGAQAQAHRCGHRRGQGRRCGGTPSVTHDMHAAVRVRRVAAAHCVRPRPSWRGQVVIHVPDAGLGARWHPCARVREGVGTLGGGGGSANWPSMPGCSV